MNTNKAKQMKIYSKRFSATLGNHWATERTTTESDAQAWLAIFRADEPGVLFIADTRKPRN